MRQRILAFILGVVAGSILFSGRDVSTTPKVEAQATTTKANLISLYRANASAFVAWKDGNKALRSQFDALSFSWVDGDFTGANAGITATQFTTAVTNLSAVQNAFDNGATLSSGFPTTIYRIAN